MDPLSTTLAALADPTRRAILARLAHGDTHVGELARPFAISAPAISRHLAVLERAGLIERAVSAQWRVCRLQAYALRGVDDWLAPYRRHWEDNLDRLAEWLESPGAGNGDAARPDPAGSPPPATAAPAPRPRSATPRRNVHRTPQKRKASS